MSKLSDFEWSWWGWRNVGNFFLLGIYFWFQSGGVWWRFGNLRGFWVKDASVEFC